MAKRIVLITGIRPNIIKAFALYHVLYEEKGFTPTLIHTNQHYDQEMFKMIWRDFDLPKPEILQYVYKNDAERFGNIMLGLSRKLTEIKPRLVIVFGDGDTTLVGALTASKMRLPLAHVEAGLRSFDWDMPEEHNRIMTDQLSDLLFTTEDSAEENLVNENIESERIHFVGNTMIDTLMLFENQIESRVKFQPPYILLTLHRQSNVENKKQLAEILKFVGKIKSYNIFFPIHPRTAQALKRFKLILPKNITCLEPQSYFDFVALEMGAICAITDSGGVQEETTFLGTPCLTLRSNTERPITLTNGTNKLVLDILDRGYDELFERSLKKEIKKTPLWDGKASQRIIEVLKKWLK